MINWYTTTTREKNMFFQLNPIGAINASESKNIEQKENREK